MQDDLSEIINAVNALSSLSETVIEKDYYVTLAIHALSQVNHSNFPLLF